MGTVFPVVPFLTAKVTVVNYNTQNAKRNTVNTNMSNNTDAILIVALKWQKMQTGAGGL